MRFSPLTKAEAKKNGKLFIVTLILGFFLRNNQYYITTLHEINHLLAAALSGNIPLAFDVFPDGSGRAYLFPVLGLIPWLTLPVKNFVGVSGAGLAFAAPFIIYILGLKIHLPGIAGFWIAGIPRVFAYWGRGTDFQYVVNDRPWMYLMVFLAGGFLILALWSTYYVIEISIEHQEHLEWKKRKREAFLKKLREPATPRSSGIKKVPTNYYGSPQIPSYQVLEQRKSCKPKTQRVHPQTKGGTKGNHLLFQIQHPKPPEFVIESV